MIEVRDIPDFNDYLESLLVQNECDDLEFKSAAGGFLPVKGIDVLREEPSNVESSDPNVESSKSANVATSESNVESSDPNVESSKDANVETSDANMASPVKKKMSWEELQELILKNCHEWISLEDLAKSIHRKPMYLRNHVMPILLAADKIQMLYPKNHPNQLYKVKD